MAYFEGEVPVVTTGNNGNGSMWGSDGIWAILLLALLGNRGFGFGGGSSGGNGGYVYGGDGYGALGFQLGKMATTNDVASGFSTSEIMSDLNDIILGQATMQNFINQGFAGVNSTINQSTNLLSQGICNLGYNIQTGFNGISREIADCCCGLKGAIADVKYANEKQTCDILQAINGSTQKVIDYMQNEKIASLQAENVALKGRISNANQTAEILGALSPCPKPAYVVPNPNCCYSACGGFNGTSII